MAGMAKLAQVAKNAQVARVKQLASAETAVALKPTRARPPPQLEAPAAKPKQWVLGGSQPSRGDFVYGLQTSVRRLQDAGGAGLSLKEIHGFLQATVKSVADGGELPKVPSFSGHRGHLLQGEPLQFTLNSMGWKVFEQIGEVDRQAAMRFADNRNALAPALGADGLKSLKEWVTKSVIDSAHTGTEKPVAELRKMIK